MNKELKIENYPLKQLINNSNNDRLNQKLINIDLLKIFILFKKLKIISKIKNKENNNNKINNNF